MLCKGLRSFHASATKALGMETQGLKKVIFDFRRNTNWFFELDEKQLILRMTSNEAGAADGSTTDSEIDKEDIESRTQIGHLVRKRAAFKAAVAKRLNSKYWQARY